MSKMTTINNKSTCYDTLEVIIQDIRSFDFKFEYVQKLPTKRVQMQHQDIVRWIEWKNLPSIKMVRFQRGQRSVAGYESNGEVPDGILMLGNSICPVK